MLRVVIFCFLCIFILGEGQIYTKNDGIVPLGYLHDCPGVEKNSTLSRATLAELKILLHSRSYGMVTNKEMPILDAPGIIERNNLLDFSKKTTVYASGYDDNPYSVHNQALATEYLNRGYNIIIIDTSNIFSPLIYPRAARLSREIGKRLGQFLIDLTKQGLNANATELIGFSLGGQICSFAAKYFYQTTREKVSRLTGLDPSGPCFRNMPPEQRIDFTDAERVDIVHTNSEGFGIGKAVGHVDIYVNGGEYQPGDILAIPCLVICSHLKCILYWWAALMYPKKFIALQCDTVQDAKEYNCHNNTYNYLGLETDFSRPGVYYLSTDYKFPYFRSKQALRKDGDLIRTYLKKINEPDVIVARTSPFGFLESLADL